MKKLYKKTDVITAFAVIVAVILIVLTAYYNIWLALVQILCLCAFSFFKHEENKNIKRRLLYKSKQFSNQLSLEEGKVFEKLTVACCMTDSSGDINWINDSFKDTFGISEETAVSNLKGLLRRDNIEKVLAGRGITVKVENKYFSVFSNEFESEDGDFYLLYFFDETKLRITEKEYYDSRPSVMLCVIDNADEIYQNFKESECTAIFSNIEQLIDEWVTANGGICRKFSNARMLIFIEERGLSKMLSEKFSILEKIRSFSYDGRPCELSLSIGVGKENNIILSNESAKQALDMAQSRGGDQVAIKREAQYKFYGGVSQGVEKRNKTRTRLIAKSICEIIKDCDNIIVMGHRFSDFDSLGSAVGICAVSEHLGIPAKIVIDKHTSLAKPLIDRIEQSDYSDIFVSVDNVHSYIGENTLLVVVDTHRKSFTEYPELVDMISKKVVIDHHRKSVDFIEDTVMFYHQPNVSSASEMVTELFQYIDTTAFLDSVGALSLFAGIMLDTRNFVLRTGVRTFEAAAYLRSRNANTVEVKKLFSNDMEIFRNRNAVIDSARKYRECCAVSSTEATVENLRLITSQAADEMLNIEGIKASFVIYKNGDEINISARSFGEINVQVIMESLGGGGHQAMSACQLTGVSTEEAEEKLYKAIDKYLDK